MIFLGPLEEMALSQGADWLFKGLGLSPDLCSRITTLPFQLREEFRLGVPTPQIAKFTILQNLSIPYWDEISTLLGRESLGTYAMNAFERNTLRRAESGMSETLMREGESANDSSMHSGMIGDLLRLAASDFRYKTVAALQPFNNPLNGLLAEVTKPLSGMLGSVEDVGDPTTQPGLPGGTSGLSR